MLPKVIGMKVKIHFWQAGENCACLRALLCSSTVWDKLKPRMECCASLNPVLQPCMVTKAEGGSRAVEKGIWKETGGHRRAPGAVDAGWWLHWMVCGLPASIMILERDLLLGAEFGKTTGDVLKEVDILHRPLWCWASHSQILLPGPLWSPLSGEAVRLVRSAVSWVIHTRTTTHRGKSHLIKHLYLSSVPPFRGIQDIWYSANWYMQDTLLPGESLFCHYYHWS